MSPAQLKLAVSVYSRAIPPHLGFGILKSQNWPRSWVPKKNVSRAIEIGCFSLLQSSPSTSWFWPPEIPELAQVLISKKNVSHAIEMGCFSLLQSSPSTSWFWPPEVSELAQVLISKKNVSRAIEIGCFSLLQSSPSTSWFRPPSLAKPWFQRRGLLLTGHYITLHYITLHYIRLPYLALQYSANVTLHYMKLHYIIYMHTCIHKCIRSPVGPTVCVPSVRPSVYINNSNVFACFPTKRALACRPWIWALLSVCL